MTAKEVVKKLMEYPDADVCSFKIHRNASVYEHVIWNGTNWWIGV